MTPRTWRLRFSQPAEQMNLNDREHWRARSKTVSAWRKSAGIEARAFSWGQLDRPIGRALVHVDLPTARPNQRRDPGNWAPTVKAIVDGLVDARVWPDDNASYVVTDECSFHSGDLDVVVTITELEEPTTMAKTKPAGDVPAATDAPVLLHLPLRTITPSADNLRRDVGDVTELAASMVSIGVLEPLVVRTAGVGAVTITGEQAYELIAGHRRLEAAMLAGLSTVPAYVRDDIDDTARQEAMIVENLLRKDLDPVEESVGYARLVELGLTQREIADRVGFSQSHIAKRLSLRKLPAGLLEVVVAKGMTLADAEAAASAHPDVLAVASSPAFIKERRGTVRAYDIEQLERSRKVDVAREKAAKSGLPEWTEKLGWSYYQGCYDADSNPIKQADATHWRINYNGKVEWLRKPASTSSTASKNASAAEKKKLQARAARIRERREFAGPLVITGKLDDVALQALMVPGRYGRFDLRVEGHEGRVVLDWLGQRASLPKDTVGAAENAWRELQTVDAVLARPIRFIALTVFAAIEWSLDGGYRGKDSQGLYLQALERHGWQLDKDERDIVTKWVKHVADSGGITPPENAPVVDASDVAEYTNSTIDQPQTDWVEPQLQQAADVPPAASCSSCSRPSTVTGTGGYPLCDACAEQAAADGMAPDEFYDIALDPTASAEPLTPQQQIAKVDAADAARLAERIAALPIDLQAYIRNNPAAATSEPFDRFTKTSVADLVRVILFENDPAVLRNIVAFEIHRIDVVRRDKVTAAAVDRLYPVDEAHVATAAKNAPRPMLGDDGEPVTTPSQEEIAIAESRGEVAPDRPWEMYRMAGVEAVMKRITKMKDLDVLRAVIAWEEFHDLDESERVIEATRLRLVALNGAAA